ncbi:hypothetical protein [Pseudomonas sp. 460]|uniref:hypothetical protein n=1 Tax=Pseudomonas sp. 460 TaxID=2485142 RepID=UPI00104F65D6|nr:hypothetical protein [Pseudomonas sp. 460]TCV51392.1 hypothetical protein EDB99_10758 [Pseudomonas sp. 460]
MATDYKPLSSRGLATLPGVQSVDVVGDILVVLLNDDTSIAVTRAPLAELTGLEKWSVYRTSDVQEPSLTTTDALDLIAKMASAATTKS